VARITRYAHLDTDDEFATVERAFRWVGIEYPTFTPEEVQAAPDAIKGLAEDSWTVNALMEGLIAGGSISEGETIQLIDLLGKLRWRLGQEAKPNTWELFSDSSPSSQALVEAVVESRIPALQDVQEALDFLGQLWDDSGEGVGNVD
jgi:hypothetical protein